MENFYGQNYFTYLPINEANMSFDLYLTGAGFTDIPADSPYPPPGHPELYDFNWCLGRTLPEYQIIYIAKGSGSFESAITGRIAIGPGSVMILYPGIWHRYRPDKQIGWIEHWISLNGEYLYRLTQRGFLHPEECILTLKRPETLLDVFAKIRKCVQHHPPENSFVLSAYALEILAFVIDARPATSQEPGPKDSHTSRGEKDELVAQALEFIWSHSHRNMSITDIAATLPVTRRTLERRFESTLGRSIGQEITRCRLERAKHLLTHTQLPIEHVALATGFANSQRLCKVFKSREGISPGLYRRKQ